MEDETLTPDPARLDADAVTPPDDDEDAKAIKDSDDMALSDDDMALLKQMSPEGQAMLMGLMSGEAAEHEAMELAAATAAANAEGADIAEQNAEGTPADDAAPPMAGGILDAAAVKQMIADAIAAAMGPKPDALPPAAPATPPAAAKKDRAPAPSTVNAEALIADAAAASTRAFNDASALTEGVRKDGHPGIVGAESAAATALSVIGEHLPTLKPDAEAALKTGNVALFLRFYDSAEATRRERLLDEQGAALVGAFRADATGADATPPAFILPAAHVR